MLAYFVLLLTLAILSANKGKPVWMAAVRDNDFGYGQKSQSDAFRPPGMRSNEQFLMQKQQQAAGAVSVNAMAYNPPVNPQTVPYDPPRPTGGYPAVAQV